MRVYFHSPLPPVKSGIADYSAELLIELAKYVDVVLVNYNDGSEHDEFPELPTLTLAAWRKMRHDPAAMVDIYQIGNNIYHWDIIKSALSRPGIAVIHDGTLSGVLARCDTNDYVRFCEYDLGTHSGEFLRSKAGFHSFEWQDFVVKNLGLLVDSSRATLVHSDYLYRLITRRYDALNVLKIEHHLSENFKKRTDVGLSAGASEFLKVNQSSIKISTFGFLTPPKRIDWIIDAFKKALDAGVDAVLMLAGEPHPDTGIKDLLSGVPADRVYISGFISELEMMSLMSATDIQVSLRFPSVGESSGTLTRALGLGLLCIVLKVDAFSDYSPEHVVPIELSSDVPEELSKIFVQYSKDPENYYSIAAAGRRHAHDSLTIEASVEGYLKAVDLASKTEPPSDLYCDLSGPLGTALGASTSVRSCPKVRLIDYFLEKVFHNECLRDLVAAKRCELIWLEGWSSADGIDEIEIHKSGARRVVLIPGCHSSTSKERAAQLQNLDLKRFDVVCYFKFPAWASVRPINLGGSSQPARSKPTTSSGNLQFQTRAVFSHMITVENSIDSAPQENMISSMSVPVAIVVAEVL